MRWPLPCTIVPCRGRAEPTASTCGMVSAGCEVATATPSASSSMTRSERTGLTADLFGSVADVLPSRETMAAGALLLRGFARPIEDRLLAALREIESQAPFRRMFTPGGHQMSVAMT